MEPQGLNAYMSQVRELIDAKGFSSDKAQIWQMLALIHTEVSEAADAYKKGRSYDEVGTELADAIIRILHLCSTLDMDIEALYQAKMAKNWRRPYRYNLVRGE
jgi:NTP pyrophosphatase (non-canonical NTP hydrolase)